MTKKELNTLKKSLPEMKQIEITSYRKNQNDELIKVPTLMKEWAPVVDAKYPTFISQYYEVSKYVNHFRRIKTIINSGGDYKQYIENNKA